MKAAPLLISWHNENQPVYSAHFDPHAHSKGRLATSGGDNNVRLWRFENGEVTYLTTLMKHTQAVNVVRFCPKGEMLASAGDDGNVLLWVPSETQTSTAMGEDISDDKEIWRVKHMCRSSGAEIYDLAWSPDGVFFITGSMDNVARIYNAQTGQMVRQIAEHSHYVQGVAWDPLNEFVATQSSDRSVHIYTLKTKDGQCTLTAHGKFLKMDLPARRISSNSPAPPDLGHRSSDAQRGSDAHRSSNAGTSGLAIASPAPSTPGTPMTTPLPMDPPPHITHSRRSSFGSSPSIRRSASPAPSLPLPAVRPLDHSPSLYPSSGVASGLGVKNTNIYANETNTSFFRRLTFAPDGSLLFTPAGQYKTSTAIEPGKSSEDIINTVYIYTRAGFNKPPIAHLPGHKKPSVAVKCSPVYYTLRQAPKATVNIAIDTSGEDAIPSLPDPMVPTSNTSASEMEPPRLSHPPPSTSEPSKPVSSPKPADGDNTTSGPTPAFALPYRIVYAVATQDAVLVYDTQQQIPLCVVSNLHFATFTDLSWSNDGLTLLMSSSDGFCSTLSFSPGELGQIYSGPTPTAHHPHPLATAVSSSSSTPIPTPTMSASPSLNKVTPVSATSSSSASTTAPTAASTNPPQAPNQITASPAPTTVRAYSPTRSNSASSIATLASTTASFNVNNPTPIMGSVPGVTAANSAPPVGLPLTTPPETPSANSSSVLGKRAGESESELEGDDKGTAPKKRRIAPTLVSGSDSGGGGGGDSGTGEEVVMSENKDV